MKRRISLAGSISHVLLELDIAWQDPSAEYRDSPVPGPCDVRFVIRYSEKLGHYFRVTKNVGGIPHEVQCQIVHRHWSQHVTNADISARTGLPPVMDFIRRRRLSVFGHIARLTRRKHCARISFQLLYYFQWYGHLKILQSWLKTPIPATKISVLWGFDP